MGELPPGRYTISHVDFESNHQKRSLRSQYFSSRKEVRVESKHVYVFGRVEMKRQGREYVSEVVIDSDLLAAACDANPEILNAYPLVNLHTGERYRFICNATDSVE